MNIGPWCKNPEASGSCMNALFSVVAKNADTDSASEENVKVIQVLSWIFRARKACYDSTKPEGMENPRKHDQQTLFYF